MSFAAEARHGEKSNMPEVVLSLPARRDLLDIWENIASDNIDAADRVRAAAFKAFERLADNPELGPRRKLPNSRLKNMRFSPVPGFHQYLRMISNRTSKTAIRLNPVPQRRMIRLCENVNGPARRPR